MLPIRQGLEACNRIRREVDLGLVVESDLPFVGRFAQSSRELELLGIVWIDGRAVAQHSAPPLLCRVRRDLGVLDERVGVSTVDGMECDPDGCIDCKLYALGIDLRLDLSADLLGELDRK